MGASTSTSEPAAEPFLIDVPDAEIDDLRARLRSARWAGDPGNDDWRYGTNRDALADLCHSWAEEFDWRAQEAAINAIGQFRVVLDDIPIHFLHARGRGIPDGPAPMPIVLTHGWPWTFWEFHEVIGPLTDPAAHGGDWGALVTANLAHAHAPRSTGSPSRSVRACASTTRTSTRRRGRRGTTASRPWRRPRPSRCSARSAPGAPPRGRAARERRALDDHGARRPLRAE